MRLYERAAIFSRASLPFFVVSTSYPSFFFFSSRRRHTSLTCDWSSDVCSSDLVPLDVVHFDVPVEAARELVRDEVGRASCRERVWMSVVAGKLKKKNGRRRI